MFREISSRELCAGLCRYAGLLATALALLLCAPILDPSFEPRKTPNPVAPGATPEPSAHAAARVNAKLKRGDTLFSLLARHGVEPPSAHDLIAKIRPLLNLRTLRPGKTVQLALHPDDQTVQAMEVVIEDKIIHAKATTDGWMVERRELPSLKQTRVVRGTIEDSLYESGVTAGLAPPHVLMLAEIFKHDIDFFSDLKPGDDFAVVIEETRYANGRRVPQRVLAADLQADGKIHSAFYFASGKGDDYYDRQGKKLRRSFLRAPLSFTRISSPYSLRRRHPISRTLRPHQAIDYAAPSGTPVVAIGSGKVTFSGWRGGYGKCVEVSHAGGYSSRYAHFSRIAAGIRKGAEVSAGDVIGFVGQTGHATGPHLHFEFFHGKKKTDFLTLKIPRSENLAGAELQRFTRERDQRIAQLREPTPLATPAGL